MLVWQDFPSPPNSTHLDGRGVGALGLNPVNPYVGAIRNADDALQHQTRVFVRHFGGEIGVSIRHNVFA